MTVLDPTPRTLADWQHTVDTWIKTVGVRYFDPLTNLAILTEEVGEVARHLARQYGEQSYREGTAPPDPAKALGDELADVLWVVMCLANQTGVDLTEALADNLEKKTQRDATRHRDNTKIAGI